MRLSGTPERPRLVVHRSLKNLVAQAVDDTNNRVVLSLATSDKILKSKVPSGGNVKAAVILGETFVVKAKEKGISEVVFDRAGYLYHGRIKAFAEALRKGGLKF